MTSEGSSIESRLIDFLFDVSNELSASAKTIKQQDQNCNSDEDVLELQYQLGILTGKQEVFGALMAFLIAHSAECNGQLEPHLIKESEEDH